MAVSLLTVMDALCRMDGGGSPEGPVRSGGAAASGLTRRRPSGHLGTVRSRKHGAALLTRNDQRDPATGNHPDRNAGERRHPHAIRFSDSEWTLVEQAATRRGLTPAELVRLSARALAEQPLPEQSPAPLSPGHIALIEATYRAVHLLAALATGKMRYENIDDLVGAAHNAMLKIMKQDPVRAVPGQSPSSNRRQCSGDAGRVPDGVPGSRPKSGVGRNRKNRIASTLYCI